MTVVNNIEIKTILELLRKAFDKEYACRIPEEVDWAQVIEKTTEQGVLGVCFESLESIKKSSLGSFPDMDNLMEWLGQVEYMITQYEAYRKTLGMLAGFYREHGIRMLLMKGYGLSLDYPVPEHRPTGDIDVYLFGDKERADELICKEKGVKVNKEYGFHSRFDVNGFTVENHSQFFDDNLHISDVRFQKLLLDRLDEDVANGLLVKSPVPNCYLPSATWNALFVLRHAGSHFASNEIKLRHVLDMCTMYKAHCEEIDWTYVLDVLEKEKLKPFYDAVATICKNYLGYQNVSEYFRGYQERSELANRVLDDIFLKKIELPESTVGIDTPIKKLKYSIHKSLRWYRNRWKYKIVYNETMWESFSTLAWNRLKN